METSNEKGSDVDGSIFSNRKEGQKSLWNDLSMKEASNLSSYLENSPEEKFLFMYKGPEAGGCQQSCTVGMY